MIDRTVGGDSVDAEFYTFDHPSLVTAFSNASHRGVIVRVVVDRGEVDRKNCRGMCDAIESLLRAGVDVVAGQGQTADEKGRELQWPGIHHSKSIRAANVLALGSLNATRAAQRNCETLAVGELTPAGRTRSTPVAKQYACRQERLDCR